jgi:chemotaxis protein MotB
MEKALSQERDRASQLEGRIRELEARVASYEHLLGTLQAQQKLTKRDLERILAEKEAMERKIKEMKATYDTLLADLQKQIKEKEIVLHQFKDRLSISLVDRILFDFGKATLTPEGRRILKKVAGSLRDIRDRSIRVIGHTDPVPIHPDYRYKFPSNWELSAARAATVVRFLQRHGVDPHGMEAVGRSFYDPVAPNDTEEGRSRNRRVEILIAPLLKERP